MRRRLIPLLFLALGVAAFLALRATRPEPPAVTPEERSWRVEVQQVTLADHVPELPLYGELIAPDSVTVTSPLAARVAERPVREGQRVDAGALLVALDEADYGPPLASAQAEVADLEAQIEAEQVRHERDREALARERELLDNARRQFERSRSLVQRNLAARSVLDNDRDALARVWVTVNARESSVAEHPARLASLEANLARARAGLAAASRDAERSRVTAPFDGIVTRIEAAPGDRVAVGAELLSIYPRDGLELRARVPHRYQAELLAALDTGIRLEAHAEGGARFVLAGLAGESDPAGTEAILRLVGEARGLRPGGLLPVRLQRPVAERTLAVPASALYGEDTLYLMNEVQRMQRLGVVRRGELVGEDGRRRVLVAAEALRDGQQVIVTHLPNAIQGLKVETAEAADAAADAGAPAAAATGEGA